MFVHPSLFCIRCVLNTFFCFEPFLYLRFTQFDGNSHSSNFDQFFDTADASDASVNGKISWSAY